MIKNVGIVGAGQMGCGIAQVAAMAAQRGEMNRNLMDALAEDADEAAPGSGN